jgi:hypothetical protein
MGLFSRKPKNDSVVRENKEMYYDLFPPEKRKNVDKEFVIKARGVTFQNEDTNTDRQLIIEDTPIGYHFMLIPEEDNKYDEFAVRIVRFDGFSIGYFPSPQNKPIWKRFDEGFFTDAELIEKPYYDGIYGAVIKITQYL